MAYTDEAAGQARVPVSLRRPESGWELLGSGLVLSHRGGRLEELSEYADEVGALLSPSPQRDVCEVRWG